MNTSGPVGELIDELDRAEAALGRGDMDVADAAMAAAADLCRRLQTAGVGLPVAELGRVRDIAERCGAELHRLAERFNGDSFRDENLRRGIRTYHETINR